jgi:hypothetical protein
MSQAAFERKFPIVEPSLRSHSMKTFKMCGPAKQRLMAYSESESRSNSPGLTELS